MTRTSDETLALEWLVDHGGDESDYSVGVVADLIEKVRREANRDLDVLATWIAARVKFGDYCDHACPKCMPKGGPMVDETFLCAVHVAHAIATGVRDPQPAAGPSSGQAGVRQQDHHRACGAQETGLLDDCTCPHQNKPRPLSEWHEDMGPMLWWRFPVVEAPYAGDPRDEGFPDYVTHWTRFDVPSEPKGSEADRG